MTVDDYLAAHPARATLDQVRTALRAALPDAEESISYKMPTYSLHGKVVLHFAGFKAHWSLFAVTQTVVAKLGTALAPYEVNDRGTVRFLLSTPVPTALIARIAKARAAEVKAATKA